MRDPADPSIVDEIVAVMRDTPEDRHGWRVRAIVAVFIEDYTAEVRGKPLGCFHLVTFNADGQAQHIAAHYRPLSSLMFFSRLLRERFAGTDHAERFLAGQA
jgi:hypothetical protein